MIINHNMSADFASRALNSRDRDLNSTIEKLSSGLRINRAGDDASGLAVSEKMRSQIGGLNRASKNVQDGISFIQTTEGYLAETTDVLHRVRELAVQAANGIYSSDDRAQIEVEVAQLVDEIDRVARDAQFNGMNMLTGRFADGGPVGKISFHIGANVDQSISTNVGDMSATALGLIGEGGQTDRVSIATPEDANRTLASVDKALQMVTAQRSDLGAVQTRMTYLRQGVDVASENIQAAESRIRDTDMASEMTKFVKSRVLSQASTAMLAQANAQSSLVLSLLNG